MLKTTTKKKETTYIPFDPGREYNEQFDSVRYGWAVRGEGGEWNVISLFSHTAAIISRFADSDERSRRIDPIDFSYPTHAVNTDYFCCKLSIAIRNSELARSINENCLFCLNPKSYDPPTQIDIFSVENVTKNEIRQHFPETFSKLINKIINL